MSRNGLVVGGYRVLRELENDSLGVVYEAEHPRLHRKVAVRTIGADVARDVSFSRKFLLELRCYVALEHPAIPRMYELAYDDDRPYLVSDLIPGTTLDQVLNDGVQRDPAGVLGLLRPIASALDYAHSRGAVHRDVKPAHILLADDGRTLLTGFGLGTVTSFTVGPGAARHMAPDYLAPERLIGRDVDSRADVYSLAAVIFEAVSGRRPFTSKSWIETLSRRLYEPAPNARDFAPDLPEQFAVTLQQGMDRDPALRPQTAGQLLERLRGALHGREVVGDSIHWLQPAMHRSSIGLSALLALVVGAASLTWLLDGAGLSLVVQATHRLFGLR